MKTPETVTWHIETPVQINLQSENFPDRFPEFLKAKGLTDFDQSRTWRVLMRMASIQKKVDTFQEIRQELYEVCALGNKTIDIEAELKAFMATDMARDTGMTPFVRDALPETATAARITLLRALMRTESIYLTSMMEEAAKLPEDALDLLKADGHRVIQKIPHMAIRSARVMTVTVPAGATVTLETLFFGGALAKIVSAEGEVVEANIIEADKKAAIESLDAFARLPAAE